jgi:hypothetical protein
MCSHVVWYMSHVSTRDSMDSTTALCTLLNCSTWSTTGTSLSEWAIHTSLMGITPHVRASS